MVEPRCCDCNGVRTDRRTRQALQLALIVNAAMFGVEIGAARMSGSVSLLADSIDFLGDAANYALSLAVLGMTLVARSRAAMVKAATMAAFGVLVIGQSAWNSVRGETPEALTMGTVGIVALSANFGIAWLLFRFRSGDSNLRSVWICSRNDALGNIAVVLAALGVFGTGSAVPDLAVGSILAGLALAGSVTVFRQARNELRSLPT